MSKLRDVGNQEEMMAKDKAEERRIFREMLSGMTTAERNSLITKDKLFPPIHYQAESEKGKDRTVLYFMKKVRDALPPRPNIPNIPYGASAEAKEQIIRTAQDKYIDMISGYCDLIQELDSLEDCRNFPNRVKEESVSTTLPKSRDTYKLTKAICCANDTVSLRRESERKQFCFTPEEKALADYQILTYNGENVKVKQNYRNEDYLHISGFGYRRSIFNAPPELLNMDNWKEGTSFAFNIKNSEIIAVNSESQEAVREKIIEYEFAKAAAVKEAKKGTGTKRLIPPPLKHIRESATDYRDSKDATQEDLMATFQLKAVAFGNSMPNDERQTHANFCYDAFKDLAKAMNVADEDIGLGNRIGMQYGANGRGGKGAAAAHYSIYAHNINLTRMSGAGSLAHEWGHALDHFIGERIETFEITASEGAADHFDSNNPMCGVMRAIKYKEVDGKTVPTDYLNAANELDATYSKTGNGYWNSDVELFARAFSCYVKDKLSPDNSDYLCGHTDWYAQGEQGKVAVMPLGEERQHINEAIDKMLETLKERGILHERPEQDKSKSFTPLEVEDEPRKKREPSHKSASSTPKEKPEQSSEDSKQLTLDDIEGQEPEAPSTEAENNLQQELEELKSVLQATNDAKELAIGDVVRMDGYKALDNKFNLVEIPSAYGVVTEVSDDHISFDTYKDKDAKDFTGKETMFSTDGNPWQQQLASRGFELVSKAEPVKEVEQQVTKETETAEPEKKEEPVITPPPTAEDTKGENSEMKGTFQHNTNLDMLKDTLEKHEPFVAIAVSTTGIDRKDFSGHEPIRVAVARYEYDESVAAYKPSLSFDEQVLANKEAIQNAVDNIEHYDVFKNAGLVFPEYRANALSKEDFQQKFNSFMQAISDDKPLVIENGSRGFAAQYLDKIGCADTLHTLAEEHRVIQQTGINQEYLHTIKGSTLEALRNKMNNTEIEGKIIGADNRVQVMAECAIQYGREQNVLESDVLSHLMQEDIERRDDYSRKGVEKYQNSDIEGKFATLIEMGALNADAVMDRDGDCDINKLYDAMESSKGVIVMQVATTGFDHNKPSPQLTGEPIQITAAAYPIVDGKINPDAPEDSISFNIQASPRAVTTAMQRAEHGGFDTFKDAKINTSEYLSGKGVVLQEDAAKKINEFFQKHDDYTLITNGSAKGSDYSFSQTAISNLGNLPMTQQNYVDFTQAVKEYSYQQLHSDAIPENVALDPNNIQKFSLGDIAKSNGVLNVDGTQYKVYFMAQVVSNVAEQHRELTQPEQVHTQESPAQEIPTVQGTAKEVEPNLSSAPEAPQNTQEATQPTSEPPQVNQPAPEKQPSPAAETPFMGVPENTPAAVHELPTEKQTDISKDDITDALDSVALEGQGVAYDEVRDDAENAEKSSQTAPEMQSSGFTNSDVSKLIDVIAVQNTVLTKQSEALMAQTNKLVEVMETQNQMIRSIIELQHNSMGMDRTPVQEAPAPIHEATSADIPAAKTPQEKLRAVQDVIRDVRKEINSPSGSVVDKDMSIVLSKLSNMANNLDKQEQQHKKSSPQKGVEQGA